MARKKHEKLQNQTSENQVGSMEPQLLEVDDKPPEPRRFTPKDCPMCESHRPKGLSFSRVYSIHGNIRYCRCEFCRHTWSQEGR